MPKVILMPVSGTAGDAVVMDTVLATARLFDGHLLALHVRPDVRREIAALAAADVGLAAGLGTALQRMEADAEARVAAAERAWKAFATRNHIAVADSPVPTGVSAEWRVETGREADWVAEYGRAADLIVVGRPRDEGVIALDVAEAALMDTGRPVLLAADTAPRDLTARIAIAWKNTREAGRAVAAALPLIRRASAVTVYTVSESEMGADDSAARLVRGLRWHNPAVNHRALLLGKGTAAETLLDGVQQSGAGLLVMGGYGHTRLREAVFGGFTRAILEHAPLPVLMAH